MGLGTHKKGGKSRVGIVGWPLGVDVVLEASALKHLMRLEV